MTVKGACSDPQPYPPYIFFKHTVILVPEVESYLEGFMCEAAYYYLCSLWEIYEKQSWKLNNVVIYTTIYKTISNINIVFVNFPTITEQAPLTSKY